MANTVYGPYAPTTWVDGTTAVNQAHMNNIEKQASIGLNGFNGDLLTPFVLSGLVCTKDGTIANQLDVTAGRVYIQMTDGTVGLIVTAASVASQFLTATPSTTYFLDLNPDGTWSWGTSHSAVTHHLTICSVTTDASGNISVVTDARTTATTLLAGMVGPLAVPGAFFVGGFGGAQLSWNGIATNALWIGTSASGGAKGIAFGTWDGSVSHGPFSIGGQFGGALAWVDNTGQIFAPAVQWGVGVGGAYSHVTYDPTNHFNAYWTPQSGATALGHVFVNWTGSAQQNAFGIGGAYGAPSWVDNSGNYNGPVGGGVPTTRAGTATTAAIYTSTATPTGNGTTTPATGALWAKA